MIERKDNTAGSAFGPIIVMIDASRLSHSLATALKDRPHGIPVQPNRSLPLRPPPPTPVRVPLTKSPKNSSSITPQATATQKSKQNSENCGKSITKDDAKDGNTKNDRISNLGVVGMNFYDSKDNGDDSNGKNDDKLSGKIPKDVGKFRNAKSLDNDRPDGSNYDDKRRKSLECETIRRNGDTKKKNTLDFESPNSGTKIVQKEKEKRSSCTKKRKLSNPDENADLSRGEKSPRFENSKGIVSQNEDKERVSKSKNFEKVESSDMGLPTIYKMKYRNSESNSPPLTDQNPQTCSPNTYKYILPKPTNNIPKCPVTIPIAVAHAINQRDLRNSNIHVGMNDTDINKREISNVALTANQYGFYEPKINNIETSQRNIPKTLEDIENTLPSMPSLEDMMQTGANLQDKLTLHRGDTIDTEKTEKTESIVASELISMAQARILQVPSDLTSEKSNSSGYDSLHENINAIYDQKSNQSHESIVNLTTFLKIHIPGRSPEIIIVQAPQIISNGELNSIANNSPIEAITPVSLSSGIQPALEEPKKLEELTKTCPMSGLREYRKDNHREHQTSQEEILQEKETAGIVYSTELPLITDQYQQQSKDQSGKDEPQYTLQHKSPVEYEIRIKDTSDSHQTDEPAQKCKGDELIGEKRQEISKDSQSRSKVEDIVRCRKIKLHLKLKKHYEEKADLKYKMSQTNDPSRLTRYQQKLNCAEKKIENTHKYLDKLMSIKSPRSCANTAPSRIQVRQDLVQKSPESAESPSQSPLHPTNETDKASTERSQQDLYPVVITISESESGEDTSDADEGESPDDVKPRLQSDPEMKFTDRNMTNYDTKVVSAVGDSSPDDEAVNASLNLSPRITNNNVEYLNKNLPPVGEDVPATVNTDSISVPRMPVIVNNDSIRVPQVRASVNTDLESIPRGPASADSESMGIPQGPASANTGSTSIPRLPASANTDWIKILPLIRDPVSVSSNNLNGAAPQKSPIIQYGETQHSHSPPDKFVQERSKSSCEYPGCLQGNPTPANENTAKFDGNNCVVSDLRTPSTIRRSAIQENPNVNPVPNYPVHRTEYGKTVNVPSMFSRDNGGANINLSSPLQGHSAIPVPQQYYRNLTAQGYPTPAEHSPNHQTAQWHSQHPQTKSPMQFTPDQDAQQHSPMLVAHLLNSQVQEHANFASSVQLSRLAQGKEANQTNPAKHVSKRITNTQFPTLGNYAAQMTRDSVNRKVVNNSTADQAAYKATGSDMYKMTATAVNTTNPTHPTNFANTGHWPPGIKPSPEQLKPTQGFSSHRNVPHLYQREYQQNPQMSQNIHNGPSRYPGSEVFLQQYPGNHYHHVSSGTRNTESSGGQYPRVQQNGRQYQLQPPSTRPLVPQSYQNQGNSATHVGNSVGMMPQQYLQQQPPSYLHSLYPQLPPSANNHQKYYINPPYHSFNHNVVVPPKQMDNGNSTGYNNPRPSNKNANAQMQQQMHYDNDDVVMRRKSQDKTSNVDLLRPLYNMTSNLNPNIIQDGRNAAEPLNLGRSNAAAPHLGKVHKSSDRRRSLICSLCGNPGPKFNCLGCETAFYCNEYCQTQHWGTHFLECPKKCQS